MAEYYKACKRVNDGKYDYTVSTDEPQFGPEPIGYCTETPMDEIGRAHV